MRASGSEGKTFAHVSSSLSDKYRKPFDGIVAVYHQLEEALLSKHVLFVLGHHQRQKEVDALHQAAHGDIMPLVSLSRYLGHLVKSLGRSKQCDSSGKRIVSRPSFIMAFTLAALCFALGIKIQRPRCWISLIKVSQELTCQMLKYFRFRDFSTSTPAFQRQTQFIILFTGSFTVWTTCFSY